MNTVDSINNLISLKEDTTNIVVSDSSRIAKDKPTPLFIGYCVQLVFRCLLLMVSIIIFLINPDILSFANFNLFTGFQGGVTFIDFVFIALLADVITKMIPNVKISMGSLKQYKRFHVPTVALLEDKIEKEGLLNKIKALIDKHKINIKEAPKRIKQIWQEATTGSINAIKNLLRNFSIRKIFIYHKNLLFASSEKRKQIRRERNKEMFPVLVVWCIGNLVCASILSFLGLLTPQIVLIWVLLYFVFDMVCVVLWCPLQVAFMKNRCCTTCRIFNWDAIMAATPLLFIAWQTENMLFCLPIIAMALIVLIRWEYSFARYPERFDESTNSSLSCVNCHDKLCYIRTPLVQKLAQYTDETKEAK